ncbi:MAG: type II restriction endonuclease [Synergistaceae bacterium]|nr:type II restriction endonuclease [Synergistaceae bacterium]
MQTLDQYVYFMRETGLFGMLVNPQRSSLYDYVTGVEVGMDSHSRKGRSGKKMEYLVESFIKATGKEYYYQMTLSQIKRKWHMDFSAITPRKKFDFVVKTDNCVYAIEVNFYNNDGSKQTETARSYMMLAEESKSINNFKFVWITDGGGWLKSRNSLEEAFNVLDDLYNIADMEHGILKKIFV